MKFLLEKEISELEDIFLEENLNITDEAMERLEVIKRLIEGI